MNPVLILLPTNAWMVANNLCDTNDPAYLVEDLVLVRLPGSTFIDVSWKPEHDPNGTYAVTVYRGSWDNQLRRVETRSAVDAGRSVESLAERYVAASSGVYGSSEAASTFDVAPGSSGYLLPFSAVSASSGLAAKIDLPRSA